MINVATIVTTVVAAWIWHLALGQQRRRIELLEKEMAIALHAITLLHRVAEIDGKEPPP